MGEIALANYFGFDLIDYKRQGDGILISSGAGIMMAIMGICPRFKYCIDIDSHREINSRVPQFISALDRNTELEVIGIAGFFSIDKPTALVEGISKIKRARYIGYSGNHLVFPDEHNTLKDFIEDANRM